MFFVLFLVNFFREKDEFALSSYASTVAMLPFM